MSSSTSRSIPTTPRACTQAPREVRCDHSTRARRGCSPGRTTPSSPPSLQIRATDRRFIPAAFRVTSTAASTTDEPGRARSAVCPPSISIQPPSIQRTARCTSVSIQSASTAAQTVATPGGPATTRPSLAKRSSHLPSTPPRATSTSVRSANSIRAPIEETPSSFSTRESPTIFPIQSRSFQS